MRTLALKPGHLIEFSVMKRLLVSSGSRRSRTSGTFPLRTPVFWNIEVVRAQRSNPASFSSARAITVDPCCQLLDDVEDDSEEDDHLTFRTAEHV
mmetsp:Transcript_7982/g.15697  ORF Transcript_7982/g.15697 Transcript_7982/m.15697 type:complete len:95 (-) Transcript_7982:172-456(-)